MYRSRHKGTITILLAEHISFGNITGGIEASKITEEPAKKSGDSAIVHDDVDIMERPVKSFSPDQRKEEIAKKTDQLKVGKYRSI